jgi:hypothetical protein
MEIVFIIAFVAAGIYVWGRSSGRREAHHEAAANAARERDWERMCVIWTARLEQQGRFSPQEEERYRNFLALKHARDISMRNGRAAEYTPSELLEGVRLVQEAAKKADLAGGEVRKVAAAWDEESQLLGHTNGPLKQIARDTAMRYEKLLLEAGEVNEAREFRSRVNNYE